MDAGLDPATVAIHAGPPPPLRPVALVATAGGLAAVTLVAGFVVTREQTRALRRYAGTLVALGLPPAWTRRVLMFQHIMILALATALAVPIAAAPPLVLAQSIDGFVVSVPRTQLAVLAAAVYRAAATAALLSSRALRARDAGPV